MPGVTSQIPSELSPKDPRDSGVVYGVSFLNVWGMVDGDSILSVISVAASPSDLEVSNISVMPDSSIADQMVAFRLSGGSTLPSGQPRTYTITVTAVSKAGQTLARSAYLCVQNR